MKTIQDILKLSTEYLKQRGISNARRQAEDLLCDALNLGRMQLYLAFDQPLVEHELAFCRSALMRRGKGEPLAYIKGQVDFYGCEIHVSPAVLIPRPETEILVDMVVQQLKNQDLKDKTLWDVCCGSGCIGIALKKALPDLDVYLSDISPEAVEIAKKNAEINSVKIKFFKGDLLLPFRGQITDYLVCNPPYVSEEEFILLDSEVKDHEPALALIGGSTGLDFYDRLAISLKGCLKTLGKAWFEIGYRQGPAVYDLFQNQGWKRCRVEKDWSGHDRFFSLENE